jgi:hypothetical protein
MGLIEKPIVAQLVKILYRHPHPFWLATGTTQSHVFPVLVLMIWPAYEAAESVVGVFQCCRNVGRAVALRTHVIFRTVKKNTSNSRILFAPFLVLRTLMTHSVPV